MRVGEVLQATVTSVHGYGIHLEAEGRPGFVQPTEASWRRGEGPLEVASAGATIAVLVLAVDPERFSASVKRARPELDPWRDASDLDVGSEHDGVVTRAMDWGVVVAIRPEVEAVLVGRSTGLGVGDRVRVAVTVCRREDRRLEVERR